MPQRTFNGPDPRSPRAPAPGSGLLVHARCPGQWPAYRVGIYIRPSAAPSIAPPRPASTRLQGLSTVWVGKKNRRGYVRMVGGRGTYDDGLWTWNRGSGQRPSTPDGAGPRSVLRMVGGFWADCPSIPSSGATRDASCGTQLSDARGDHPPLRESRPRARQRQVPQATDTARSRRSHSAGKRFLIPVRNNHRTQCQQSACKL